MGIYAAVKVITPERAQEMLLLNGNNRRVRQPLVMQYARIMQAGDWRLNGEGIILGQSGRLLDGQHRLHAVVKCGIPQSFLVVQGIEQEDSAYYTMNSGQARSQADRLETAGETHVNNLAAALRWGHCYLNGTISEGGRRTYTPNVMFAMLEQHPEIREWVTRAVRLSKSGFLASSLAWVLYAGSRHSELLASEFAKLCETGENLSRHHPVALLRNRVMAHTIHRIDRIQAFALYVKAWNAFVTGESLGLLRWSKKTEEFPSIIGMAPLIK